ncbi:hypothetical protein ABIB73_000191 [Bradyrhizobium sp. F1.4.3]
MRNPANLAGGEAGPNARNFPLVQTSAAREPAPVAAAPASRSLAPFDRVMGLKLVCRTDSKRGSEVECRSAGSSDLPQRTQGPSRGRCLGYRAIPLSSAETGVSAAIGEEMCRGLHHRKFQTALRPDIGTRSRWANRKARRLSFPYLRRPPNRHRIPARACLVPLPPRLAPTLPAESEASGSKTSAEGLPRRRIRPWLQKLDDVTRRAKLAGSIVALKLCYSNFTDIRPD